MYLVAFTRGENQTRHLRYGIQTRHTTRTLKLRVYFRPLGPEVTELLSDKVSESQADSGQMHALLCREK